jgi:hypothetical protein
MIRCDAAAAAESLDLPRGGNTSLTELAATL